MKAIKYPTGSLATLGRKTVEVGIVINDPDRGLMVRVFDRAGNGAFVSMDKLKPYRRR
jgi:hypothetical protein